MSFPALQNYLARLPTLAQAGARVWLDRDGRAQGRYFNCTLTSAFQPVRVLDSDAVVAFEAFARSYSEADQGLSLWKLLDHAANDDESVELDRLCRMLHAINFYRQPGAEGADLFLSVHDRLLAAVSGNHGMAFRRILDGLGLPVERVVLQLPAVKQNQSWLLSYVANNYRRNGFRFGVNIAQVAEAVDLLERARPDVIKLDARELIDEEAILRLLSVAGAVGTRVVFKRVENTKARDSLRRLAVASGQLIHVQGQLWDLPAPVINAVRVVADQTMLSV